MLVILFLLKLFQVSKFLSFHEFFAALNLVAYDIKRLKVHIIMQFRITYVVQQDL